MPGRREVVAVISTETIDRDGEVVLPGGLERKNYAGLGVFYDHNTAMPLGVVQWVKRHDRGILGKYRVSDKTQFARDMFSLLQDGVLSKHSIGFVSRSFGPPTPTEAASSPDLRKATRVYRQWELLELSLVGVPANPDANLLAISKKLDPSTCRALGWDLSTVDDQDASIAPHPENTSYIDAINPTSLSPGQLARLLAKAIGQRGFMARHGNM